LINVLFIIFGLLLLIKGSDFMTDGAIQLSKKFGVSELFIGLTLVSFGTSAPELVVGVAASLKGSGIVMGNVVGSNIANLGLILGLVLIFKGSKVDKSTIKYEMPFLIFLSTLLTIFMITNSGNLSRLHSIIFLILLIIYIYYLFKMAVKDASLKAQLTSEVKEEKLYSLGKIILLTILGLVMLTIGGDITVDNAIEIAKRLNVSETLIGITIVAIGTSLPELATSISAARKNASSLVIGNLIGSNIFNILIILGISGIISPIIPDKNMLFDTFIALIIPFFIFCFIKIKKENVLTRFSGIIIIIIYILYMAFRIIWR